MTALGWFFTAVGMVLTAAGGWFAYQNGMFWPSQVMARWGQKGIAFSAHGGMWSDLLFLAPLCGVIVYYFGNRWSNEAELFGYKTGMPIIVLAAIIGFVITAGNHVHLMFNQRVPDPLGWQKEWWSAAIGLHFIYMWGAATILVALCFTKGVDSGTVALTAVLVGLHMTFGIHIPLGIVERFARTGHFPEFLRADSVGMLCGIWLAVLAAAWYAGGIRAAFIVLAVGLVTVVVTVFVMNETEPLAQ